jgi:hypothetical protein
VRSTSFIHTVYSKLKYVKRPNKVNAILFDSGLDVPLNKGRKTCTCRRDMSLEPVTDGHYRPCDNCIESEIIEIWVWNGSERDSGLFQGSFLVFVCEEKGLSGKISS